MPSSPPLTYCPSIEEVCAAISTLYHNPDPKEKERASDFLGQFQKSVYAWKVSDELLHKKISVESCYIAAQTIRSKIQYSFHELPADSHGSLKDSLLEHVNNIGENTNNVIVTQLCLAMADLVLLMPEWKNAVTDLLQRFGQARSWALLEILTVLPEEVNSRALRLGANRREEIINELKGTSTLVMEFLKVCLVERASSNVQYKITVFKCLTSWLQLEAIPLIGIEQNIVMQDAFAVVSDFKSTPQLHEAATDCVCALIVHLEQLNDANHLEMSLFTTIRQLEESYHMAVAQEDLELAINYCRIFTEYGESMLLKMVHSPQQPHFAVGIFESVLLCCGHPDYEIPDITFNLFYRLSEELYQKNEETLTEMFRPYIQRLICTLCRHCQMEPDSDGILEEGEDFSDFRIRSMELTKDIVFIVGSTSVFKYMFDALKSSSSWEQMESALYVMSAVARNILPQENEFVPQVVNSVLGIPDTTHMAVRHSSIKLVGELCEWIEHHPEYLERILNWLLVGLQSPKVASEAATALQNICSQCQNQMVQHFQGLVHILESIDTFNLKPNAATGLIKGVSLILTNMPHSQIQDAMKMLCLLQVQPLTAIVEKPESNGKIVKNSLSDPVLYLDRMAAIFRHVVPQVPDGSEHPCQAVIMEVWPVLSRVCDKYQADVRIIERCCRTIRFAVRCVRTQSAPLLEPLVKQMVTLYQVHPHSCFLYLGSILIDEYAHLPGCVPGLLSMIEAFLTPTFNHLGLIGLLSIVEPFHAPTLTHLQENNNLRNHPDTVDDFFRLNARFLQRSPMPFLQTSFLKTVIGCALVSCYIDHRDANASVMKFFYDLLHCGRSGEEKDDFDVRSSVISGLRTEFGPKLVENLIRAAIFNLPSYTFHDIGDVLFELMLYGRVELCYWLEATLKGLPTQNHAGIETVTRKQLVEFHNSVTKAEKPHQVSDAIRDFTRLWR